jgi:hypothetical protein
MRGLSLPVVFCVVSTLFAGCSAHDASLAPPLAQSQRAAAPSARPQTRTNGYSILHVFGGGKTGSFPNAAVFVRNGTIFGTTATGGLDKGNCSNYFCGTAFSIQPSGKNFAVIYNFSSGQGGSGPYTQLTADAGGALYGSSLGGGELPPYQGQVYKLSGAGKGTFSRTVVRNMAGGKDGDTPSAMLLLANGTTMVGTTAGRGGGNCCGTVFQVNTDGSGYRVLHYFAPAPSGNPGKDGGNPAGALVEDPATQTLYGILNDGGKVTKFCTSGCGTVYQLVPSAGGKYTFSVIYRFKGNADGMYPSDQLVLGKRVGNGPPPIYGTTTIGGNMNDCYNAQVNILTGCGMVYVLNANGKTFAKKILYRFQGYQSNDGSQPIVGLTLVGSTLYGTTSAGGSADTSYGTVFGISTSGTGYKILHSFVSGDDGGYPSGVLTYSNGFLYGVTSEGGSKTVCTDNYPGCGTIYSIAVH